jgi:hypothetical protein
VLAVVLTGVAIGATIANGDFESGDLSGWTVSDVGSGSWSNYTGTTSPISGFEIAAPPQGLRAAVTDQTGPGRHVLYREVTLEADHDHTLSFTLYYANRAGAFFTPATLDPFGSGPNQQYRVDVVRPGTPVDDVDASVLRTLFLTGPGDALALAPTPMTFDLSEWAGQTVRLRFAEVDNQLFFQAAVDDVRIVSVPRNAAPVCSHAVADPAVILVPNHGMVDVSVKSVTDPDGDPIAITITSIRQDEPTDEVGDGAFAPDGVIADAIASVRAERDGSGDGRVYHVGFKASDGRGGTCTGTVRTAVPRDRAHDAVDGGALYYSTE